MDADDVQGVHHLGWLDCTIFGLMLFLSSAIGIYFGFFGSKQKSYDEFMLGGGKIGLIPICMSTIASHISSLTLIALPTEIYLFGTAYWLLCPSLLITMYVTTKIFLPVLYALDITNIQQYLEMRFNRTVRIIGTSLYCINTLLFLPIVVYVSSLTLNQGATNVEASANRWIAIFELYALHVAVSGINLYVIGGTICTICIFYTMLGGLKAIVWTDGLQAFIMLISCIVWIVIGTWVANGVSNVWTTSEKGGRIQLFDMNPSPFMERTFWTMTLGHFTSWLFNFGINPVTIQRYLAVQSLKEAKIVMISYFGGTVLMTSLGTFTGLIIYTIYGSCDLVLQKVISKHDQLMSYFIMNIVGHIPGLPGLFIAAVVSGTLSTMSATVNTLSGIIYEEFVALRTTSKGLRHSSTLYVKLIMIPIGVFCLFAMFIIDNMGEIMELTISINGISLGALTGIYLLGMTCPWANVKGVIVGVTTSFAMVTWIVVGAQLAKWNGSMKLTTLPLSTTQCVPVFNSTVSSLDIETTEQEKAEDETFILYKISFLYYSMFGTLLVIIVGGITSFLTKTHDLTMLPRNLIAPPFQFLLPNSITDKNIELKLLEQNNR